MDYLNIFQQLFLVLFAILYGLMLSKLEIFKPFPFSTLRKLTYKEIGEHTVTTNVHEMKQCKWRRLILSLFLLVLFPFFYFLFVLDALETYDVSFVNTFVHSWEVYWILGFASLLFSFGVFGFWHLYRSVSITARRWAFCDLQYTEEDIISPRDALMELFGALIIFIVPWALLALFDILLK